MRKCAACNKHVEIGELIECSNSNCKSKYHYQCVNITRAQYKSNLQNLERVWTCPDCERVAKRGRPKNDSTPVHSRLHKLDDTITSLSQAAQSEIESDESDKSDVTISPNGNTLVDYPPTNILNKENEFQPVTLQQMNTLLQQNNKYIIQEMRKTIEEQIELAINQLTKELKQKNTELQKEQIEIKKEITILDQKIILLNSQCTSLHLENEKLQKDIQILKENKYPQESDSNNDKMLVLHGLQVNYWETEIEITEKISNIFHDIMNINISGYIEEITCIGKKGYIRPIKIELISKRMTKYILENSIFFRGTGLTITEYLSKSALLDRKDKIQALKLARHNGQRATIRTNKLFVNGEETTPQCIYNKYRNTKENTQNYSQENTRGQGNNQQNTSPIPRKTKENMQNSSFGSQSQNYSFRN